MGNFPRPELCTGEISPTLLVGQPGMARPISIRYWISGSFPKLWLCHESSKALSVKKYERREIMATNRFGWVGILSVILLGIRGVGADVTNEPPQLRIISPQNGQLLA